MKEFEKIFYYQILSLFGIIRVLKDEKYIKKT